jgi:hypothetical protein
MKHTKPNEHRKRLLRNVSKQLDAMIETAREASVVALTLGTLTGVPDSKKSYVRLRRLLRSVNRRARSVSVNHTLSWRYPVYRQAKFRVKVSHTKYRDTNSFRQAVRIFCEGQAKNGWTYAIWKQGMRLHGTRGKKDLSVGAFIADRTTPDVGIWMERGGSYVWQRDIDKKLLAQVKPQDLVVKKKKK